MNEQPRQSWASLPETLKRQSAQDMLDGREWNYYGRIVENPGPAELRRWLPMPEFPPARSNADKRDAVTVALRHAPRSTDREIARMTGTSHTFVARLRRGKKRHAKEKMATVANVEDGGKC